MKDVRVLGAAQIAVSVIAPTLLPFIGTDGVLVLLGVANALGGIAHLYGYAADHPVPMGVTP